MADRVVLGNLGSGNFGLRVSKPSANVLNTTANNLIFNSTTTRVGQIYAGANFTATSSAITWTSASKPTLTYIPEVLINEANTTIMHDEYSYAFYDSAGDEEILIREWSSYTISNTSVTPYRPIAPVGFVPEEADMPYLTRTSGAGNFIVLRIPNAFGFMGNTYIDASGTTQNLGNHPSLGNTENLW